MFLQLKTINILKQLILITKSNTGDLMMNLVTLVKYKTNLTSCKNITGSDKFIYI